MINENGLGSDEKSIPMIQTSILPQYCTQKTGYEFT